MDMKLTPRQNGFIKAYTQPESETFGNAYQSARRAGYSDVTARNLTHLKPAWLSETLGNLNLVISPDELLNALAGLIYNQNEPSALRLRAIELMMKYHGMFRSDSESKPVKVMIDLSGNC